MNYEKKYKDALERAKEKYAMFEGMKQGDVLEDVFPELKESEDEKIRQFLIREIEGTSDEIMSYRNMNKKDVLIWLEKQGEHTNFRNKIQVGDKVTRNRDGVLVNLSQLNRVAKKDEKQGEQKPTIIIPRFRVGDEIKTTNEAPLTITKITDSGYWSEDLFICSFENSTKWELVEQKPADNIEPKFKVGDFIVNDYCMGKVIELTNDAYLLDTGQGIPFSCEHNAHLWTIQDAKDGDVLAWDDSKCIAIFKNIYDKDSFNSYGFIGGCTGTFELRTSYHDIEGAHPATKEQRDLLFQKMKEAGYKWDADKKELKKIKHNSAWSEEDDKILKSIIINIENLQFSEDMREKYHRIPNANKSYYQIMIDWLKSLKNRVQPKQEWSEEDEEMYKEVLTNIIYAKNDLKVKECLGLSKRAMKAFNWFKPQNWTKEDKERYISCLQRLGTGDPEQPETINSKWFKDHVYPQITWRPSDEQMTCIQDAISKYNEFSNEYTCLVKLYNDLKKLREK